MNLDQQCGPGEFVALAQGLMRAKSSPLDAAAQIEASHPALTRVAAICKAAIAAVGPDLGRRACPVPPSFSLLYRADFVDFIAMEM